MEPRTCDVCGRTFLPAYRVTAAYWSQRRFCSEACRVESQRGRPLPGAKAPTPPAQRFWDKVSRGPRTACWEWTGSRNADGYGVLFRSKVSGSRLVRAHRVSWELHNGPLLPGQHVLHSCDNPPCVNPHHLWLGDQAANNADRDRKGRGRHDVFPVFNRAGEANGNSRLSDDQVAEVRALYARGGVSQKALAAQFGVGQSQVSRLVRGEQRA